MSQKHFHSNSFYTLKELAELARQSIDEKKLTQQDVADWLNEHAVTPRGKIYRSQITRAFNDPERNPSLVLQLVKHFTDFHVDPTPKYEIRK